MDTSTQEQRPRLSLPHLGTTMSEVCGLLAVSRPSRRGWRELARDSSERPWRQHGAADQPSWRQSNPAQQVPETRIAAEVRADRRRLNWVSLFVVAVTLGVIGGVLIAVGLSSFRNSPLVLVGQLVSAVASVVFLCAIIRWAIEPLFAQLVDTNDQLSRIARLLKEADADAE